jgi:Predicted ring-cleavage extradiol dioxygenase
VTISAIHRVSLATHDLAEAQKFFESYIGLGRAVKVADQTIAFGSGSRGLRIRKPPRLLNRTTSELHGSAGTRHVAFDTDDLNGIASRLDRAAIPYVHALPGDFDASAIYTIDPAMNVVAFCQRSTGGPTDQAIQSLVHDWGWGIHHVNLEACDVREAAAFYVEIAGMTEGRWQAPAAAGDVVVGLRRWFRFCPLATSTAAYTSFAPTQASPPGTALSTTRQSADTRHSRCAMCMP